MDQWLQLKLNRGEVMKYVRRYLQEVEVIRRTDKVVVYLSEIKVECIMCVKLFDEMYEEKV